jgi:putative SOS response-associated peptidase YedK
VQIKNDERTPFKKRRGVVPASAWFEWRGEATPKPKFRFARADGQPIWFADLWDRVATSDAGEVASFTILTRPSAGELARYYDRAPVILEEAEWPVWLAPAASAAEVLAAVRPERFAVAAA